MLKLACKVTIEGDKKWEFNALSSCVIVEDTGNLTDTCVLELPKKISWQGNNENKITPIKRGDKITVRLGYFMEGSEPKESDLKTRFTGFVRNIDTKTPVRIECEDGMFLLKLAPAKQKGFKEVKLSELIAFLLKGTGVEYKLIGDDVNLGPYGITKSTVAEELNELKRERSFMAYFRQSVLQVGYHYPLDGKNKESFIHSKNIIAEELIYRRAEDVKLKVKATSVNRNNVRSELEMGDKNGEEVNVFVYNVDLNSLKIFAENALKQYKYTGHRGSIETFGEPLVNKCDIAHIQPSDGQQGDYVIKKVEVSFGTNGYRQKIELGPPTKV